MVTPPGGKRNLTFRTTGGPGVMVFLNLHSEPKWEVALLHRNRFGSFCIILAPFFASIRRHRRREVVFPVFVVFVAVDAVVAGFLFRNFLEALFVFDLVSFESCVWTVELS